MWEIIRALVAGGVTILLTTQYLDEADSWPTGSRCSITAGSSPKEPRTSSRAESRAARPLHFAEPDACARPQSSSTAAARATRSSSSSRCPTTAPSPRSARLLDELHDAGIDVEHLSIHTPDLDDVFFAVTGALTDRPTRTPPTGAAPR